MKKKLQAIWLFSFTLTSGLLGSARIQEGSSNYQQARRAIGSINEQLTRTKNRNMRLVMHDLRNYLDNQLVIDGKIDGVRAKAESVAVRNEKLADYLNQSCRELEVQRSDLWHQVPFVELSALKTKIQEQVDEELYFIEMLDETIRQAAHEQEISNITVVNEPGGKRGVTTFSKKKGKVGRRKKTRSVQNI